MDIPRTRPNLGSSPESLSSSPLSLPLLLPLADSRKDPAVEGLVDAYLTVSCISSCRCLTSSSIWLVLFCSSLMCARSAATSAANLLRSCSSSLRIFFLSMRSLCSRTCVSCRRFAISSFWPLIILTSWSLLRSIASAFSSSRAGGLPMPRPRPSSWLRDVPCSGSILPEGFRCAVSSCAPTSLFLLLSLPEPRLPAESSMPTVLLPAYGSLKMLSSSPKWSLYVWCTLESLRSVRSSGSDMSTSEKTP
mmetsp:Transcript_50298/g.120514  ORF Transcript_50298/g.120514 Transcript_50298/m.120514 type:complete len:249 (+) Transcript_50298:768-1514(+)